MSAMVSMVLLAATMAADDPVLACRSANDVRAPGYVTCLEEALRRATADRRIGDRGGGERDERRGGADGGTGVAPQPPAATRELGEDQLEQERRNRGREVDQPVAVEIVGVEYGAEQLATVTLANGQQWRETSTTPRGKRLVAGKAYRGRIERGAVGGYRLYVDGIKHMYTVRRLR